MTRPRAFYIDSEKSRGVFSHKNKGQNCLKQIAVRLTEEEFNKFKLYGKLNNKSISYSILTLALKGLK